MVLVRSAWVSMSVLWFWSAVFELVVEVLFAGLGLFQCFAEPLVLLSERDSHEVDGFVSGVFEVAVRDVYVAVAAREFAVGE